MNDVSLSYVLLVASLLCIATLAFKFAPFWLLKTASQHSLVKHLGQYCPPAFLCILFVYSLRPHLETSLFHWPVWLSLGYILIIHQKYRNTTASVLSGTLLYMALNNSF